MKTVGKPRLLLSLIITGWDILFGVWLFNEGYLPMIRYAGVFLIAISIILVFPILLNVRAVWMVNSTTIQYTESYSIIDSFKAFFDHYIKRKELSYPIKISLDSIQSIRVTYSKHLAMFYTGLHYDVWFVIRTKDNSEFRINVLGNGAKRKDFLAAVHVLKENHVSFIDEHDILTYLEQSNANVSYYLEKLDKRKRGSK